MNEMQMDENPYAAPRAEAALQPLASARLVHNKLRIPTVALLALSGVSILSSAIGFLTVCILFALSRAAPPYNANTRTFFLGQFTVMLAMMLVPSVFIAYGALQARRADSYRWAIVAAIISMIPYLSPFIYLGIPFGIWMLIVLLRKDVKACFQRAPAAVG